MKYEVEWTTRALRELRKLDRTAARRVLLAVTRLADDPRPAGVRALVGKPSGTLRLRVGDYRVVYLVEEGRIVVTVVRVGHRREVYRS
ncbi:type II toxin-antitoxin system RelE family toxin [Candidatus Protofrankia californiensis]|uniref:type II toxin-antitoxin system RelE family toxin n=1 Tax=Candidatus Protofrankia californiensis TaxID=1839754 RepID=UPI0010417346|nr:type II toxin-antitoxin system RelE/ParE family toxin [Candidatus Protofrankia californiensis]